MTNDDRFDYFWQLILANLREEHQTLKEMGEDVDSDFDVYIITRLNQIGNKLVFGSEKGLFRHPHTHEIIKRKML
jgi:hypothetical protein